MTTFEVVAEGLGKRYGPTRALDTFDLTVPPGTVHGLLGPNGAGKTTAVRILTTLLRFDTGRATVAGYDVLRRPDEVRARIGLTGQYAAVDEILSGRQNLELFGRLFRLSRREARRRAGELLERFGLDEAAGRSAGEYSGGMRRRLDLAASLIRRPRVLFLDEPTTGLDPRSRNQVWDLVRGLVADGTTVLLTTQYLEEADQLADRISVIDAGRVVAEGSPDQLKAMTGGDRIEVVVRDAAELSQAARLVAPICGADAELDPEVRRLSVPVVDRVAGLVDVVRALDDAGIAVEDIGLRRATLDEAFLHLTGHRPDEGREPVAAGRKADVA
ncbi:ATP-binding cassette domain-containing protein [Micromonospora arida]|uniref:Daunorubicin/doxorubicin resistance ABC transporter ATP-binding protein DrrA n=1 Tax=Micromonospora arida TaxID=2203715 RepID=A0A3N9Y311_9ACTN|nr:ATP-binding cassette domain-containing protein [Micromonospora arida]RQX13747.1 daunorubicin/doxorubicin resistance ABC transporter ATP-binding protein DrrA [Micromonospora arida]